MNEECTCPIRSGMSYEELENEILIPELYCTSLRVSTKGWLCENFQQHLERARVKARYQKSSKKAQKQKKLEKARQLKRQGLSNEEIVKELRSMKPKQRRPRSSAPRKIRLSKTDLRSF